jgi:hypothetical protein
MAYDPKAYLDQALKTGFESVYSQPASLETGEAPQYQGDVATFGDVQVRPLMELIGASGQDTGTPQQSGHMVSVPLTGQYQGYFRNDIYDNDGNFVKTTVSEPDTDKYGLKSLAQLGLTAASLGGFGPVASTLAKGIGAIQSKNPLALLSAVTGLPGADKILPAMPSAVSDVLKYAGQAKDVSQALKGDPSAIFRTIIGADKALGAPSGKAASAGYGGADPGYFDPDAETSPLPDWALDPYKDETKPGDYYAGLDRVINEWDEADIIPDTYDTAPKTSMPPQEMARFLEANIDDPGTIDTLMQDYFPELYRQTITTTGTLPKKDVIIPDWDMLPPAVEPPKSIRDVGNVTKISPDEKLEGTDITEPDLTTGLPKAVVTPAPKPADQGKAPTSGPTPSPAPKAEDKKTDLSALFALLGAMGGQQPTQAPAPYQTARIDAESPFGLMYGLES